METEAALVLAKDLGYISQEQHEKHNEKLDLFIRKLYKYMQYLESKIGDRKTDKTMWYRHEEWKMKQDVKKRCWQVMLKKGRGHS